MASPVEKLNDGIDRVCAVCSARSPDECLVDEAFAKVKVGIIQCRKDSQALEDQSQERAQQVLFFLARRALKKKAAKGQINECLRILLSRASWLCAAQQDSELLSLLRQTLAENVEVLAKLEATWTVPQEDDKSASFDGTVEKPQGIQEQLNFGFQIMKSFDWEFPHDPLGTKIDEATDGFKDFFDAVTLLTTTGGKTSVGGDIASVLTGFEHDWDGILQFFLSMYNCGFRASYRARIRFVVVTLRSFSPAFRSLLAWAELPWGSDPMPPEEAAAEAARIAAEDHEKQARMRLEQEDFQLALEMHMKEEEQRAADELMRKQLSAEDSRLAQSLHDKELSRVHLSRRNVVGGC